MNRSAAWIAVLLVAGLAAPAVAASSNAQAAPAVEPAAPPTGDAAPAPSDSGPTAPSPDTLVARALARSPSLAALQARVEQARAMVGPAGALPNPMVEVMLQDASFPRWTVGRQEMSMIGPQVTQTFPFPGKQAARRRAAEGEVGVRGGDLEAMRRQVAREVRSAYAEIYALDRERRALSAGRELLEMLAATVRQRFASGVGDEEAAVKAQLEVTRVAERLDDNAAMRASAVAALDRLLDAPAGTPLGRVDTLPAVEPPPFPWTDAVLAGSAEVAKARAEVAAAGRRLAAARLELWPDVQVGAGEGFRGGMDPVATFRVGLDLPLWAAGNQRPAIRAAQRDLDAASAGLRDAEAGARADAARLEAEWRRSSAQVPRYAEGIVPQTSLAFDAARSGYLAGRTDFTTLIEDFRLWFEARAELARREAERYTTWAGLEAALRGPGIAPAATGGTR